MLTKHNLALVLMGAAAIFLGNLAFAQYNKSQA